MKQDLVYAFRTLAKSPAYAAVTVLTLALGIGANTAIFSVVNGVLLKPLGYPNPDRLQFISSTFPRLGFDRFWISVPEYVEFKERNRSFESVGGYREGASNLGTPERPRRVNRALVTPELLNVLGVPPMRGRLFNDADAAVGAEDVAIISASTWRADFGAEESVVGRVVQIDGGPARIVGIMPPGFDIHDERIEVYLPLTIDPSTFPNNRGSHFLMLIGRLKPGVTIGQAQADIDSMVENWGAIAGTRHAPSNKTPPGIHMIQMQPLKRDMIGNINAALWVLQGAVGFVLLIACANLANLILARAESRQREFAIRSALGAGRFRLLKQFLTEGILLALIGGALGAAIGFGGVRALLAANPTSIPRALDIALDWKVLAFTLGVSLVTGLVFGLAPLVHLREHAVTTALKEGGQRSSAGTARARVRSGLVMAEVALAVVLVVGAGLLLRSFQKLMTVDAGFNREHLTTFGLVLSGTAYRNGAERVAFFNRLMDRLREQPGVTGVAAMAGLPPNRPVNANDTDFEGYAPPPNSEEPAENVDYYQTVTLDYLKTMGISIVKGRGFEPTDVTGGPVLLVNEALEKRFYTRRKLEAVGQRANIFTGQGPNRTTPFTIVGVVRDVKQGGMANAAGTELYFLNEQIPKVGGFAPGSMNIAVRTTLPEETIAQTIQQTVRGLDPSLPIVKLRSMEQVFSDSAARPRFLAALLAIFAGLALALAAIGTYGILSYSVSERTKEIGIHMALGATRGSVMGMVLGQGMRLTLVGVVTGLAASFGLTRLLQAQLFNVKPTDPLTLSVVAVFITVIAFVACFVPAQRATRVDPMVTLRDS